MMKKAVGLTAVLTAILVGILAIHLVAAEGDKPAKAAPAKGEQVTLTGRLSCTFCTLAHPEKPCPKECCQHCIKGGDTPSLTESDGTKYLLLNGEQGTALMTAARMELLGGDVTVKGLLVKGKGVQAIYVDSMDKAAAPAKADAKVTITGRLSCTFCTLAHPEMPCTKECCNKCWAGGDPAALTDAQGNIYTLVSPEQGTPLLTPARKELGGQQVTVKGLVVRGKGIQAIYVDSMEKAEAGK